MGDLWIPISSDEGSSLESKGDGRAPEPLARQRGAQAGSLVLVTPVAAGGACPAGGEEIWVGLDANRDGALDKNEVRRGYGVCDAAPLESTR